jgi:hypothetical protein
MQSTRQLHEELAWLSAQLEAARDLERAAEKRHSNEDMAETEAALKGRREEALGLRERHAWLLEELDRRAVAEKGWAPERSEGNESPSGAGRAGRLHIDPHPLSGERGFVIRDHLRAKVAWVRRVPTPARASELLAEHGVPWEGKLITHKLSPLPEEVEEQQ